MHVYVNLNTTEKSVSQKLIKCKPEVKKKRIKRKWKKNVKAIKICKILIFMVYGQQPDYLINVWPMRAQQFVSITGFISSRAIHCFFQVFFIKKKNLT